MKFTTILSLSSTALFSASLANAAFVIAADLDSGGGFSPHPNFSFGGDTTAASGSVPSLAVGLPDHDSIFGGNGNNSGDTYIFSYTPGTDVDNFSPMAGSILGSTTGFGSEISSGRTGGESGAYNVFITVPSATNSNTAGSTITITGDDGPIMISTAVNSGDTGPDLDPGPGFVGGANNAWFKVGTVNLTAGNTYTLTMEANVNSFVSQRVAGVMWEPVTVIPETSSSLLLALGFLAAIGKRRR